MGSKMQILLTKDVDKLGRAGEIKDVSGGYGRNYLIPQGFAVIATKGQMRQAEERLQGQSRRDAVVRRDAEALANRLNGQTLRFEARVGELDRLYGSVTSADIAARIASDLGIEVDRRKIDLDDPLKRLGIYPIAIRLAAGLAPVINVVVEGEGGVTAATQPVQDVGAEPLAEPDLDAAEADEVTLAEPDFDEDNA